MKTTNKLATQNSVVKTKSVAVVADRKIIRQHRSRFSAAKIKVTYNQDFSSDKTEITKVFNDIANGFGKAIARADHATNK